MVGLPVCLANRLELNNHRDEPWVATRTSDILYSLGQVINSFGSFFARRKSEFCEHLNLVYPIWHQM